MLEILNRFSFPSWRRGWWDIVWVTQLSKTRLPVYETKMEFLPICRKYSCYWKMKPKRAVVSYHGAYLLYSPAGWPRQDKLGPAFFRNNIRETCQHRLPQRSQPLVRPAVPSLDLSKKFPAVTLFVSQVLQPVQFGACCTGLWSWPGQIGCSDIRFYSAQLLLSKLVLCPNKEHD